MFIKYSLRLQEASFSSETHVIFFVIIIVVVVVVVVIVIIIIKQFFNVA